MRHILYIFVATLLLSLGGLGNSSVYASTNDFYFSDSTFDYYLEKNESETSTMRVKEVLTAVFPSYDQNHGIERCIPTYYRGVKTLDESTFSVTRNGSPEPFSTYSDSDFTCFRIGNASSYVHNEQVYAISYTLNNVILEPDNSENQELYWDTNGTSWSQEFKKLTATVHLSSSIVSAFTGATSCYVGTYRASGLAATSRCETLVSSDNSEISFSTSDLDIGENLTLDLEFKPKTFKVPKDYSWIAPVALLGGGGILLSILSARARKKMKARNAEKIELASAPKPVQYLPPKGLTIAESSTIWLTTSLADSKVASLMELAVKRKIELEKAEKVSKVFKHKSNAWKIHVKDLTDITDGERIVLEILNGGKSVTPGSVIEVKNQTYSSKLATLLTTYTNVTEADLRRKHLLTEKADQKLSLLASKYNKYEKRTLKGIEMSNYLDGLHEYVDLAEKDRIKFLHSVDGADVSNAGIVKLYEKLLPYAIIFRCEDSWLEELNRYYEMPDVDNPDWLMTGALLSTSDFRDFRSAAVSSVVSATAADSSGSSGGGGGGFSGGGGGGGGGGGW